MEIYRMTKNAYNMKKGAIFSLLFPYKLEFDNLFIFTIFDFIFFA